MNTEINCLYYDTQEVRSENNLIIISVQCFKETKLLFSFNFAISKNTLYLIAKLNYAAQQRFKKEDMNRRILLWMK